MQCPACRAVFSNGLDTCPRCKSALPLAKAASAAATVAATTTEKISSESPGPQAASAAVTTNAIKAEESSLKVNAEEVSATKAVAAAATTSTLLEFPGANRNVPQWRKDLSERVREIQERRAREAAREAEEAAYRRSTEIAERDTVPQSLGLISSPEAPPLNPLVAAALRRIERARQPPPVPRARTSSGGAATAVARVAEEQYSHQTSTALVPAKENLSPEKAFSGPKARGLVVVTPKPILTPPEILQPEPAVEKKPVDVPEVVEQKTLPATHTTSPPSAAVVAKSDAAPPSLRQTLTSTPPVAQPLPDAAPASQTEASSPARTPRKVFEGVVDDAMLARREAETTATANNHSPLAEDYDDRASLGARLMASLIDLLVVGFASSPFAAIIELTNGNWTDPRVSGAMAGIVVVVMFLYATISTLLVGRTWGMSLVSVRAVDARSGLQPSTKQAVARTLVYITSLALCGLGILYALVDAEGRTLHDHVSGTVVIRD